MNEENSPIFLKLNEFITITVIDEHENRGKRNARSLTWSSMSRESVVQPVQHLITPSKILFARKRSQSEHIHMMTNLDPISICSSECYPFDAGHSRCNLDAFDQNSSCQDLFSKSNNIAMERDVDAKSYLQLGFTIEDYENNSMSDHARNQQVLELSLAKLLYLQSFVPTTCHKNYPLVSTYKSISLLVVKCSRTFSPFYGLELTDTTESSCSEVETLGELYSVLDPKTDTKLRIKSNASSSNWRRKKGNESRRPIWSSTLASEDSRKKIPERYDIENHATRLRSNAAASVTKEQDSISLVEVYEPEHRNIGTFGHVTFSKHKKHPRRRRHRRSSSDGTHDVLPDALDSSSNPRRSVSSLKGSNSLFALANRISRGSDVKRSGEHQQLQTWRSLGTPEDAQRRQVRQTNHVIPYDETSCHLLNARGETRPQRCLTKSVSVRGSLVSSQEGVILSPRYHVLGSYLKRTSHGNTNRSSCNSCGL